MIYLEEKEGIIHKYKIFIDYDKLNEIYNELIASDFRYEQIVDDNAFSKEDIDFNYIDFDYKGYTKEVDEYNKEKGHYYLIYSSKLSKILKRIIDSNDENDKAKALNELREYECEDYIVSLIDVEIKRRKEGLKDIKDLDVMLKELYKIKELYKQMSVASKLIHPLILIDICNEARKCITYEEVNRLSKEMYLRVNGLFTLAKNEYLKYVDGVYFKYQISYSEKELEKIYWEIHNNTGFMNQYGVVVKTNLEKILLEIFEGNGYLSTLVSYDPESENINIFRKEYRKKCEEIYNNTNIDIDKAIELVKNAKEELPYSDYNMSVKLPQDYYIKIMKILKFNLVTTESFSNIKEVNEFVNEDTALILKKDI